jgi:hypothetical protein
MIDLSAQCCLIDASQTSNGLEAILRAGNQLLVLANLTMALHYGQRVIGKVDLAAHQRQMCGFRIQSYSRFTIAAWLASHGT